MASSQASRLKIETAKLRTLEELHLQPLVRGDRDQLASILHESFTEIGASGRVWSRADILEHLPDEPGAVRTMSAFECQMLSDQIALTTYVVTRTDAATGDTACSRRSSVWCLGSGGWRLRFHQGTPL